MVQVLRMASGQAREPDTKTPTNATLFPDLDGMARSLNDELEFHWGFDPLTGEGYDRYRDSLR